jgi:hypothetical protein
MGRRIARERAVGRPGPDPSACGNFTFASPLDCRQRCSPILTSPSLATDLRDGYDGRPPMSPRDLQNPSWPASTAGSLGEPQHWAAQLQSVPDMGAIVGSVPDVKDLVGPLPDMTKIVGSMPNAGDFVGPIPDVTKMVGPVPVTKILSDSVAAVTGTIRGSIPDTAALTSGVVGDFTGGISLDGYQRSIGAATAAQKSPALGGTFRPPTGLEEYERVVARTGTLPAPTPSPALPWKGQRPRLRPDRQSPVHEPLRDPFLPSRPRRGAPAEPQPASAPAPSVQPDEIGGALAQSLTREHRREAKSLLVVLGLDAALEHLEAIEKRLLDGGRPDRLHAALSASLLLEGMADRLFPARDEPWVCRFEREHEIGVENVRNRLTAFAEPLLKTQSTIEHKLFIAEFDYVGRWTGEGHHVVFTQDENAEAFRALLKVLATIARAHRLG